MSEHKSSLDFRALFESAPGAYLVLFPDLSIAGASDAYLAATMTTRAAIVGRPLFEVFPDNPDEQGATGRSNLQASLQRVLDSKEADSMPVQKYDIQNPHGRFELRYWIPLNTPVLGFDNEIRYIIHSVEDVTDFVLLKQERIQLRHATEDLKSRIDQTEKIRLSQRMQAMGQLAGGAAHDFNNMLAVILMSCDVVLERELPREAQRGVVQIRSAAERAAKLTRQLLAFSRKQIIEPAVLDINTIIRDLEPILRRLINYSIELDFRLADKLGHVFADATQIEQILINLLVNARDAMPSGGRIFVESRNEDLDHLSSRGDPPAEPGRFVLLSVRDTGIGMDSITRARIFEPFFTTKQPGKGTGLGLATVYGIVSQIGGTIWVHSELHRGTLIKVYLPLVEEGALLTDAEKPASPVTKTGTILVVEDEADLRALICATLASHGFTVHSASNGAEGLTLIEHGPVKFDLVISDVMMPVMTGLAMRRELRMRGVSVKILFLSGYSEESLFESEKNGNGSDFLAKPFNASVLLSRIQAMLE